MAWYNDDIEQVPTDIRQLFENYSGVSPDDVVPHVLKIVSLLQLCHTQRSPAIVAFRTSHFPPCFLTSLEIGSF